MDAKNSQVSTQAVLTNMSKISVTDRLRKTEGRNRPLQTGRNPPSAKERLDKLAQRRAAFLIETNESAARSEDRSNTSTRSRIHVSLTDNANVERHHERHHDVGTSAPGKIISSLHHIDPEALRYEGFPIDIADGHVEDAEGLLSEFSGLSISNRRCQGFPFKAADSNSFPEFYNADRFHVPTTLSGIASSALVSSFNALTSNLFCGTPLKASAAALAGSKQVRLLTLTEARGLEGTTALARKSVESSPGDIRTVYKMFDTLDPKLTVYACCPDSVCSALYPPKQGEQGILEYPLRCSQTKFGRICGEMLVKDCAVANGISVPRPLKPYSYHHFNDHVAGMLSRPGMEEAIESHTLGGNLEAELTDIMSSQALRRFHDVSGKPFLRQDNSVIRLVWAFAADWFNPHSNKAAGKAVSTGVMAMICLSLPPSLRYLEENIYLAGLIPGPREPALDAANHFIRPLMNDLKASYERGVYYSRTHKYSSGRISHSAVIPVIADTLASKKITGNCGHGGKYFCSRCRLPRAEIDNIEPSSWPPGLTRAAHEEYAEAWRLAPNKTKQETLVKVHGIRWSALLLLPYWQPSDWSVTEGVHVLLLGVTARHCRDLLGLNFSDLPQEDDDEPPSAKCMEHARRIFDKGSPGQLHKLKTDALKQLCIENGVSLPPRKKGRSKKKYISALLGCSLSSDDLQPGEGDFNLGALFDGHASNSVLVSPVKPVKLKGVSSSLSAKEVSSSTVLEVITQQTLTLIREHIQVTLRPDWQAHLPADFGSPAHGKLKADQWRTALEFDIPVSLVQVLANHQSTGNITEDARLHNIVEHTLDLAMALAWGLSRRTSKHHAGRYNFYMQRYLKGIQTLFPDYSLKPNHHYALHISDILLLFGPLHGTWAFSLERLIGRLQKLNTNSKIGDMENTAMHTFCRRSNLIRLMESDDCPPVLVEAWSTFRSHLSLGDLDRGKSRENRLTDAGICSGPTQEVLRCDIRREFEDTFHPQYSAGQHRVYFNAGTAQCFRSYERQSVQFTDFKTSEKHSLIYFSRRSGSKSIDGADLYPGQIRQIFQHSHLVSGKHLLTEVFIAVHVYAPVALAKNPFAHFADFRAGIFQLDPSSSVEVIRASQIQCHANVRPWDKDTVVMRAIDREY